MNLRKIPTLQVKYIDLGLFFLLLFSLLLVYLSKFFSSDSIYRDLLINISAGFIGSILTFFLIDFSSKIDLEREWKEVKDSATQDLISLSISLSETILLGLNIYRPTKLNVQLTRDDDITNALENLNEFQKSNPEQLILAISPFVRKNLKDDLNALKNEFENTLFLYKDVLPPVFLQRLWKARTKFNKFSESYIKSIDFVFNGTSSNPRTSEEVAHQKLIKSSFLKIIAYDLKQYLLEAEILIKFLTKK
jgi:hypothetical protein